MSKTITIRKGLNIKLKGKAELTNSEAVVSRYGIKPTDFPGLTPKLSVKADDIVKAGTVLFYDKNQPEVKFCSPVSGKVVLVNRGDRRRILEVEIESDGKFDSEDFSAETGQLNRESIKQVLLNSGLWPFIVQRPFGVIAQAADTPRDIFVSAFDTAPLAPDYDFSIGSELTAFQKGIEVLGKLTDGKVYIGVKQGSKLAEVKGAEVTVFDGPHPAGNVGIQLHKLKPINKGEKVWTINPQAVVFIGRLFSNGKLNLRKLVAITGSEVVAPKYLKTYLGAKIGQIIENKTAAKVKERIISGNVLTGQKCGTSDFLGFYHNQITIIPEGNEIEPFGWATPGFDKFSAGKTFLSKLFPRKEYVLNANYHGGERAYVVTEQYEKVLPMDILPVYLIKAIIANDIDKMEQLGIYEVIEEDLALCEFACTSKIEVQETLRKGINSILKELA